MATGMMADRYNDRGILMTFFLDWWWCRQAGAVLFFLACWWHSNAQEIWVATASGEIHTIQLSTCATKRVANTRQVYTDIAWHPNGKLYGINASREVYEIDWSNQQEVLITTLPTSRPILEDFINSMVIDADGLFYFAGFSKDLITFDLATRVTTVLGNMQYAAAGDLTFSRGELYLAAQDNKIVKIHLQQIGNETLAIDRPTPKAVFGLVTLPVACDSTLSFAFSDGPPTDVYTVDFSQRKAELKCRLSINVQGASTQKEPLGSSNLEIDSVVVSGFVCGLRSGQIRAMTTGGIAPLSFSLDGRNFQNSPVFSNLPENDYLIRVRDAFGCTDTFRIQLPIPLPVSAVTQTIAPTCGLSNGSFKIQVEGGSGPYQISVNGTVLQGATATLLGNGNYNIVVTDALGCSTQKEFTFSGPLPPSIVALDKINTSCGDTNGIFSYKTEDGIAPLKHRLDAKSLDGTGMIKDLSPGTFFLVIEDAIGCEDSLAFNIAPSEPLFLDSIAVEQAYCELANGRTTFYAREGTGTLAYSLNGVDFTSQSVIEKVPAGSYTAMVKDVAGCVRTQSLHVPGTKAPNWVLEQMKPAYCGDASGALSLKVAGGTPPLLVSSHVGITTLPGEVYEATGLGAGIYNFIVTDSFECVDSLDVVLRDANCLVVLPIAFSPDGNGQNDVFEPLSSSRIEAQVELFFIADRWGAIVHQVEGKRFGHADIGWKGNFKGQAAASGVYVWYLQLKFDDGENRTLQGNITLIR